MSDTNEHDPQPAPIRCDGSRDVIIDLCEKSICGVSISRAEIMRKLLERREFGIEKYGQPLMSRDGRDSLKDLEDEMLDALAYAHKIVMSGEPIHALDWTRLHMMVDFLRTELAYMKQTTRGS